MCVLTSAPICTKSTTSHSRMKTYTHKRRLPMRQMRSERSHIKQPNLSCFAFIASVHFHNALKTTAEKRWRHGKEWRKMRRVVERNGDREKERARCKKGRGYKIHPQSNLNLVDVWGCNQTR